MLRILKTASVIWSFFLVGIICCTQVQLLLEELLKLSGNGITDLRCCRGAADVLRADTVVNRNPCRVVNLHGVLRQAERVFEHHAHRQNGSDGVDNALAGNIGCGAYIMVSSGLDVDDGVATYRE